MGGSDLVFFAVAKPDGLTVRPSTACAVQLHHVRKSQRHNPPFWLTQATSPQEGIAGTRLRGPPFGPHRRKKGERLHAARVKVFPALFSKREQERVHHGPLTDGRSWT
jgi:hypothetical protein